MPVGSREPEAAHPLVELRRPELQPDRDRADVGRLGEDVGHGQRPAAAALVRLVDRAVGHLDRRPDRELRARRDQPLLQRAGDRERLERRAGLVGEADRAVLARVLGRLVDVVRVDARPVGHREDLAVARVHHDGGRAARLVELPDLGEDRLRALLDRGVDREAEVLARLGALDVDDADRLADGVLDDLARSVGAVQRHPRATARGRSGRSCRCRRCRAPATRASPADRCGAARRPCRSPRCRASRSSRRASGRACACR